MAKDVSGFPWKFDAAAQAEGVGNSGQFDHPIYVRSVTILVPLASPGGVVVILDRAAGRDIVRTPALLADSTYEEQIDGFVDGIYIDTLPASVIVYVKHGAPLAPAWLR